MSYTRVCSSPEGRVACSASVIIPNLHSPHVGTVLHALEQQSAPPLEVIVVGQDRFNLISDDGWVRFIRTETPVGRSRARNIGLTHAAGDIFVFLDADCIPVRDWLYHLLDQFGRGHAIVGGSIGLQPGSYWFRCDNLAHFGAYSERTAPGMRPYLLSGNLALRRDVVEHCGAYDERLQSGLEDTELSFRLRKHGYALYFEPRAMVFHQTERQDAAAVWRHIYAYGSQWESAAAPYATLIGGSWWQRCSRRVPALGAVFLPLLALRDVLDIYRPQPYLLLRDWQTIFGVSWARVGWWAGVLEAEVKRGHSA